MYNFSCSVAKNINDFNENFPILFLELSMKKIFGITLVTKSTSVENNEDWCWNLKNIELKFLKDRNTRYEVWEIRNLQGKNRKILSSGIKYSISNVRYESWKISLTQAPRIQILRNFVRQNKSKRISILVAKPSLFLVQFLFHSTSVLSQIFQIISINHSLSSISLALKVPR